ncbi:MAG: haloalkane dehalogenase [Bacteroidota bacterium]
MDFVRTPDDRFSQLKDWPYAPKYLAYRNMRMHYVDEGEGEVVLALHGEPSWAYLYRKFIPVLSPHNRFVVPDLLGFGRSDKPTRVADYTYQFHYDSLIHFIERLELRNITLVVQDWGGLLGLGILGKQPEWFKRVVVMNTFLPKGSSLGPAFSIWQAAMKHIPNPPISRVMKLGIHRAEHKTPEVLAAYTAPFPGKKYKAGAKAFPGLVPGKPNHPTVPWMLQARETLKAWDKPAMVLFSDKDAVTSKARGWFTHNIPTAKQEENPIIKDAGHFLQEENGEEIAGYIHDFIQRHP